MTSQPDSPPTTAASQEDPDIFDIVATRGAYLVPRASTPVWPEANDGRFAAALERHLNALLIVQRVRRSKYHDAADEWPIGHTPPEVKEKHEAELKAWDEIAGVTSESSDNDDDDNNKDKGKPVAAPEADWFPTPPPSAESPMATSHKREQRRISREDEKKEASAAAEHAMPNMAHQKGRKRRRTRDVGDKEEGDCADSRYRPTKRRARSRVRGQNTRSGRVRLESPLLALAAYS
ncbi:hypothetical protein F5Y09DRAFT_354419 [Xylaria sp. FL1042]|nr:hypothetical protein F5Y09DRAFT_354419 [Xylaria sp. FL1042]